MNIGFFAMSGIRVCNAELLKLGLTLPGFVERSKTIASLPSLGLLTLAGLTPPRHSVRYVDVPDVHTLERIPEGLDLAAISTFSAQVDEAYALAGRLRAAGVRTVIGGPHVTAEPDEALRHCDAVVAGEGEPSWPKVLDDAAAGRLQSFYPAPDTPYDLAQAPMPRFEMLDLARYNRLTVQTSRGCPRRCEFCASSVLITRGYRKKPVPKVVAEIDRIRSLWPHPFIEFADDNTFVDKAHGRELVQALRDRNIRWFTETDISVAEDEELLEGMRDAGCQQILIGLESPTAEGLRDMDGAQDWKYRQFPRYKDAIWRIQSHGITVNGCFVIGLDGHTPAIFDEVIEFVRASELYEVQVTILTPFPGTPLHARLLREGRLLEPRNWKKCTLFDINYEPRGMTVRELDEGFRRLVVELYGDEFTHWRRSQFTRRLKQGRRERKA